MDNIGVVFGKMAAADMPVVAAKKKRQKRQKPPNVPWWLIAPAAATAAGGVGGAYAIAGDQQANTVRNMINRSPALGADETALTRYIDTMSQMANSKPFGVPVGKMLTGVRTSPTLMSFAGMDPSYVASTPGAKLEAATHYDSFADGPVRALEHMMLPAVRGNTALPEDPKFYTGSLANSKGKTYGEVMQPYFNTAWGKYRDKYLPGGSGRLQPYDVDTTSIPHADQMKFLKMYQDEMPPEVQTLRKHVEDGMAAGGLDQNMKNYAAVPREALKLREALKTTGITAGGAAAGGMLGHHLYNRFSNKKKKPSVLGHTAATLTGAGLGGAAGFFGGTQQGRDMLSSASNNFVRNGVGKLLG